MKVGTEDKKKVAFLAALGLLAAYMVYSSFFSGPSSSPRPLPVASERNTAVDLRGVDGAPAPSMPASTAPRKTPLRMTGNRPKGEEFHPMLRPKRPEDRVDPATIDPELRLDLLAKVQEVKLDGGARNLFQFGAPPVKAVKLEGPETFLAMGKPFVYPQPDKKPEDPKPVAEAPPPPITLKYYGLATKRIDGKKTAFFLDGEEIILAPEGYTVKKKYRVVRIGINSVLMEDTESKRQQSLPLAEDTSNASE
jgi:hypothetical protein